MKKIALLLSILCTLVFTAVPFSYAVNSTIVESPDIKIVVDGKIGTYDNVPIIVNGRTLLPLRAVLVNLGIQDDDQHIIWKASEQSVTVIKDATNIYLKINSGKATVNGTSIDLDVAPLIYKDRTYIPLRFVSQSLGKKVVWSDKFKSALIRDEGEFNKVKDALTKVDSAMNSLNKVKLSSENEITLSGVNIKITQNAEADWKNKIIHTVAEQTSPQNIKEELYVANNIQYRQASTAGKWLKNTLSEEEFNELFNLSLGTDDVLCASLFIENSSNPDEIIIKGNVDFEGYSVIKDASGSFTSKTFYMGLNINTKTYLVNSITSDLTGNYGDGNSLILPYTMKTNTKYSDFNGSFDVTVPADIEKNVIQ